MVADPTARSVGSLRPMSAASEVSPRSLPQQGFQAVRLADRLGSRDNNFDLLRLLAAWSVLVSHSFALLGRPEPLHQFGTSLGNLGVLIFFAVSGLLIRRSWEYDPSPRDFWAKRGLRLLPALATVSILTAFVLGPLETTAPAGRLLLLGRDLDLPRAGDAAHALRRRPARGLRGQPVRRGGQRPALEPAARGLRLPPAVPPRPDRAAARDEPSSRWSPSRGSRGPRCGCRSPPTPSARRT